MKDEGLIPQVWFWVNLAALDHGECLVSCPGCLTPLLTVAHFDFFGSNCFMLHLAMAFLKGTSKMRARFPNFGLNYFSGLGPWCFSIVVSRVPCNILTVAHFDVLGANCFILYLVMAFLNGT